MVVWMGGAILRVKLELNSAKDQLIYRINLVPFADVNSLDTLNEKPTMSLPLKYCDRFMERLTGTTSQHYTYVIRLFLFNAIGTTIVEGPDDILLRYEDELLCIYSRCRVEKAYCPSGLLD